MSKYRLRAIHRRWRQLLGPTWSRKQDVELTELLLGYQNKGQDQAHRLLTDLLDSGLHKALTRPSQSDEAAELAKMEHALTTGTLKDLTVSGLAEHARKLTGSRSLP